MKKNETKQYNFKSMIVSIKTLGWLGIIMYCAMCIVLIIYTTTYSLEVQKNSIEELSQNEAIINYISTLNNYSYSETIEVFSNIEDKIEFVFVELIIPTLFKLFGYILLIISLKDIIVLIKNVTDKKSLFTEEKYQLLKKLTLRTDIALFLVLNNLILWGTIGMFIEIIQYLFNCCVNKENK